MTRRAAVGIVVAAVVWAWAAEAPAAEQPLRVAFRLAPNVGFAVHADGFGEPRGLLISPAGDLYVADRQRNEVVRIGQDGRREVLTREVTGPGDLAINGLGMLYVAAMERNQVLRVSPHGVAYLYLDAIASPASLAFDPLGNLLVCEPSTGVIRAFSGPGPGGVFARAERPYGLTFTREGVALVAENGPGRILRVHPDGRTERFAEGLHAPEGIAIGPSGDLYVAEPRAGRVSRIGPDGARQNVAEGLNDPRNPVFDAYGQLLVAESGSGRIIRLTGDF
ncbi:MAG TPA: NHL repeat-containing protein [Candidatus Sulfotelmatobacter sp.]|nr:NHL repeat-containing protein [Candidatus Sulfotelmatobacter sp.]